jgi:hypothetical protein
MVRERQWQDMEEVYRPGAKQRAPKSHPSGTSSEI